MLRAREYHKKGYYYWRSAYLHYCAQQYFNVSKTPTLLSISLNLILWPITSKYNDTKVHKYRLQVEWSTYKTRS